MVGQGNHQKYGRQKAMTCLDFFLASQRCSNKKVLTNWAHVTTFGQFGIGTTRMQLEPQVYRQYDVHPICLEIFLKELIADTADMRRVLMTSAQTLTMVLDSFQNELSLSSRPTT